MADGPHPGPNDFRLCEQRDVVHSLLDAGTCSPCVVSRGGGDRVSVCCRLEVMLSSLAMYVLPRSPKPEEDAGSCVPAYGHPHTWSQPPLWLAALFRPVWLLLFL